MGLPSEPIVKKFFSNKIESTRGDWYSYLIRIARIFYSFDGQEYDREKLLDQFTKMSGRQSDAQRDVSNFRDEFGAYGTYLGIYHLEQIGGAWKIIVSNAAKQFLCVENPNAAAFCRAQLALFQYPNGAGAALTSGGSINVQANSRSDTVREISNGIRLNPFRLICRIVVSQVEIAKRALNEITIPYETLFCMVNDDRINRAYSPPLEVVNSVFSEYSTAASQVTMILDGITNFKRNFHILEKTGLFTRGSRFGLMVAQANYTAAYECIKAVSGITASFDAFESLYEDTDENAVRDIIASPAWGQYYDAANLDEETLEALGVEVDKAPIKSVGFSILEADEDESDPYRLAAKRIHEYVLSNGFTLEVSEDELHELYGSFNAKFSPDALSRIPDAELLTALFYSSESTNDSLCYWLEFNVQSRKYFGSIAGGSSFKFGLYQRKEDNVWISGSPSKPEELSDADALVAGRGIRDMLVKGAEVITSSGDLSTPESYEELDEKLNAAIGKYAGFAWVHKYFQMVFPTKFATWHSSEWQRHLLLAYGVRPSTKYYGRSGQLAIVAHYAEMSAAFFSAASYDRFGDIKQFCRLGTSDGTTNHFSEWRQDGIAAIGWPDIGPLDAFLQGSDVNRKAIFDKLVETYYPSDNRTASRKAGELATYYRTNENTIFVAMDGESLLAVGDAVGVYFFVKGEEFPNRKPLTWHSCFSEEDRLPNKSEGLRTSCVLLADDDNLLYLYHKYYYELSDEEAMEVGKEEQVRVARSPRDNPLHPLNQIIYGAPGTGKTYSSIEYAMAIVENRPVDMTQRTKEQRQELMQKYSETVTAGQVVFTTFHQSYGYEEFVQGIRPDTKAGAISFKKADGVFKTIADAAMRDPEKNYVIIIDEINRGNISKIFGELITLIEDDKRYGELNQLSVSLPLGERFSVPNNLYVIGTMNSADKSISLIDTALRRRFVFVEMAPDESLIGDPILQSVLLSLNTYIKKELRSTDLLIGHAYFIGKSASDLGAIMNNNIIPLLYEYFYDDEAKVKKSLDCLSDTHFALDGDYRGRIRIKKKD
ncbi:MAG TPA: AAA family ATPase [Eubacteriales bacterium]|nr:AAA family ATPase [Eubacteriales bacterium]